MIYVNGDSWTSGWPDEETYGHREFSWPHLLSKKLDCEVFNDARAASSNARIFRRTFDFILKNKPPVAIICLTYWIRQEIGNAESGKIYQYLPSRDPMFFKQNWHPYLQYSNCLRQIISLQLLAKITGTELFLLDTYNDNFVQVPTVEWFKEILKLSFAFDAMDDERIYKKFLKILDLSKEIDYNYFLSNRSYQDLIQNCTLDRGHPVLDGHEKIAEFIFLKLKEKYHGQTI